MMLPTIRRISQWVMLAGVCRSNMTCFGGSQDVAEPLASWPSVGNRSRISRDATCSMPLSNLLVPCSVTKSVRRLVSCPAHGHVVAYYDTEHKRSEHR